MSDSSFPRRLSPRTQVGLMLLVLGVGLATFPRHSNAACVGDCDSSGVVSADDLVTMTNIALGAAPVSSCAVGDADSSGGITINEIIDAVNNALNACPPPPTTQTPTATPTATSTPTPTPTPTLAQPVATPTFSLASTFPQLQATIFTPTCLDLSCHNAEDKGGSLVLEGSVAYASLAGPPPPTPSNLAASHAGMLRVDPGNPANSFLITKLTLPKAFDLLFGSRMPSGKPVLSADQIDSIRAWILRGALADESAPTQ